MDLEFIRKIELIRSSDFVTVHSLGKIQQSFSLRVSSFLIMGIWESLSEDPLIEISSYEEARTVTDLISKEFNIPFSDRHEEYIEYAVQKPRR